MFNIYPLIRPFLFCLDPEKAHHFAIWALKHRLGPKAKLAARVRHEKPKAGVKIDDASILRTKVCGIDFENPIGLAAGFDKQCEVISETLAFGFGFMEAGGVVPLPQSGNPKPRLFRIPQVRGIINRFDFNSDGFDVCRQRVAVRYDATLAERRGVLGINIAKGNHYTDAAEAYVLGLTQFAPLVDYVTINVSCPNTPNLRDLEGREQLTALLEKLVKARAELPKKPCIFVKISPDQTDQQQEDIAAAVINSGVDAMIVGNTSVTRPEGIPPDIAKEKDGFSGPAMLAPSTKLLANMYKLTQGKIAMIGCGGIFSGADAYAKIRAGASLVQLYTALIYEGPALVPRINRDLAALLRRDGFASVGEAVGADHRSSS